MATPATPVAQVVDNSAVFAVPQAQAVPIQVCSTESLRFSRGVDRHVNVVAQRDYFAQGKTCS